MNTRSLTAASLLHPSAPRVQDGALREHTQSLLRHLQDCRRDRSRWFEFACWGEALHEIVAPRFVTTVAAAGLLLLLSSGWA